MELIPAEMGISRYIGAIFCISGQQSVCTEGTGTLAYLTESPNVFCAKHLLCSTIFMDDKPNAKIHLTHRTINFDLSKNWLTASLLHSV